MRFYIGIEIPARATLVQCTNVELCFSAYIDLPQVEVLLLSTDPVVKSKYLPTLIKFIKGLNRRPISWKLNNHAKKLSGKVQYGEIQKLLIPAIILLIMEKFQTLKARPSNISGCSIL